MATELEQQYGYESDDEQTLDLFTGELPLYLQKAQEQGVQPDVLASYLTGQVEPLSRHLNKVVGIVGAIIYFTGPYMSKQTQKVEPGYSCLYLKTDLVLSRKVVVEEQVVTIEEPIILKVSSRVLAPLFLTMMSQYGWYDWDIQVKCLFQKKEDNSFSCTILK